MKPRNREINIFNLSMMDVISGAMAAFLILVVILSRDYNPTNAATTKTILQLQKELVQTTGQFDDASRQITGGSSSPASIERNLIQARDNVREATSHLAQLVTQLQQDTAQIKRLRQQLDADKKRIDNIQQDLDRLKPYIISVFRHCNDQKQKQDVAIYLYDPYPLTKGKTPLFQPGKPQSPYLQGDQSPGQQWGAYGYQLWLHSNAIRGDKLKLYYTLVGKNPLKCELYGSIASGYFDTINLPGVTLDAANPWAFVGTLTIKQDRTVAFTAATKAEQAQEAAAFRRRLHGR